MKKQFEMRKSKMYFEVIPLASVKKILEQQQKEKQEKELAGKKGSEWHMTIKNPCRTHP